MNIAAEKQKIIRQYVIFLYSLLCNKWGIIEKVLFLLYLMMDLL